jgi:hypothetical protein
MFHSGDLVRINAPFESSHGLTGLVMCPVEEERPYDFDFYVIFHLPDGIEEYPFRECELERMIFNG